MDVDVVGYPSATRESDNVLIRPARAIRSAANCPVVITRRSTELVNSVPVHRAILEGIVIIAIVETNDAITTIVDNRTIAEGIVP